MTNKLILSVASYDEIANALEALGKKVDRNSPLTIEKDVELINPIDWRLVKVRENVAILCAQMKPSAADSVTEFVDFVDKTTQYVLYGKLMDEVKSMKQQPQTLSDHPAAAKSQWK